MICPMKNQIGVQEALPLPNPGDWLDAEGVAELLGGERKIAYRLVERRILKRYEIGAARLYWRRDVEEIRDARHRLGF